MTVANMTWLHENAGLYTLLSLHLGAALPDTAHSSCPCLMPLQKQPRAHLAQPTGQQEQQRLFREAHLQSLPWQEPTQVPEPAVEFPRLACCKYASVDGGVQIAYQISIFVFFG